MKYLNLVAAVMLAAVIFLLPSLVNAQDSIPLPDTALRDTASQIPAVASVNTPTSGLSDLIQKYILFLGAFFTAAMPLIQFILKRIPTAYSVKIKGWGGKILDALTFFQPDKSLNGPPHVTKVLLIICFLGLVGSSAGYSQGLLKPVQKPSDPQKVEAPARMQAHAIAPDDSVIAIIQGKDSSTTNVVRLTVVSGMIYSGSTSYAAAGFGLAWQHLKYDYLNKRYQSQYSVGLYAIGASNFLPKNASDVGSLAALFGFKKDLIRVGPVVHIIHPKGENPFGAMAVLGINFLN